MRIIFDLKKLNIKIFLTIVTIIVFMILYKTVPNDEYQIESNDYIDLFYRTFLTHIGLFPHEFKPKSTRAKLITIGHLIIAYCILLI